MASTKLTKIMLRGGKDLTVSGELDDVAQQFREQAGGPVRLNSSQGGVVFVNWSNVLYLEETYPPAAA
jgi:hypothetical protein